MLADVVVSRERTNPPSLAELPPPPPGLRGWPWTEGTGAVAGRDAVDSPRVTIVTPSYNQGAFLEETLRSVLLQGYPNLEYIVVDGGSTDGSVAILERYAPWLDFWVSEPDRGQSHALNKGLGRATGEVLGWLNSDDTFAPGGLFALMALRARAPDAVAWVGSVERRFVPEGGTDVIRPRVGDAAAMGDWWRSARFFQPGCVFSADTFAAVGPLDERLHLAMDVDLWVRLAQRGPFASGDVVVATAKHHPGMKTRAHQPMRFAEYLYLNLKNGQREVARRQLDRLISKELGRYLVAEPVERIARRLARRARQAVGRWVQRGNVRDRS